MTAISITEVTAGSLEGTGAFDKIMSAMQIRLEEEFSQGRITGDDYANVYLGAMTASMQQAVAFVLGKQTADSQAELTKAQALEVNAQTALVAQQKVNLVSENISIDKQGLQIDAQTALVGQQRTNLVAESNNIPKQGLQLDSQIALVAQQKLNLIAENTNINKQGLLIDEQALEVVAQTASVSADTLNKPKQGLQIEAQTALVTQQKTNLVTEASNLLKQGVLLDKQALEVVAQTSNTLKQIEIANVEIDIKQQQVLVTIEEVAIAKAKLVNIPKEGLQLTAQTALVGQQKANLIAEASNIDKQGNQLIAQTALVGQQKVNLAAEVANIPKQGALLDKQSSDLVQATLNKVKEALVLDKQAAKLVTEKSLLDSKILTEEAQYRDAVGGIAVTGVIGKQKLLYAAQTNGFARDAEQKLAKIIVDTWNVRRTTDSTTNPELTGLTDVDIKRVLTQARAAAGLT
jgi:hypothetical protein